MYRLLIVDDEPIIVEGLYDTFQNLNEFSLEVYRAYNGREALDISNDLRIDILLSDIEMPAISGIELQQQICRKWPRCKTIFLTGYNDFNYVHASIRGGALDYVLKTEGDEAIIAAVRKAANQIAEESQYEHLIVNARNQMTSALPMLRKDYLLELLHGEVSTGESRLLRFASLDIPLSASEPIFMVAGRIDAWRENILPGDKALFLYSIDNIFAEYFSHLFRTVHLTYSPDRLLWFLQPKTGIRNDFRCDDLTLLGSNASRFIMETLESIQTACKQYLKLSCSFVAGDEPKTWEEIPVQFDRFSILFTRGLGQSKEMILSDRRLFSPEERQDYGKLKKIHLLGHYLEQKNREKFYTLYDEVMGTVREQSTLQTGGALEIFYSLSAFFISYLNQRDLLRELSGKMSINALFTIQEHSSWQEVTRFFHDLAEVLFVQSADENEQETNELVHKVHEYVRLHLNGDVSLRRLADIVYLTPFYLSRLYKQQTGQNLSDYITEIKLRTAKELLCDTSLKIQEVGGRIGFESPSYFNRFFKKLMRLTPQEFRDSLK